MNITFFAPSLKLSGGLIVMFKYAQALAEAGYNSAVIAPDNKIIDKIENGVHIKTFKKFPNKYFEHIFFQLIYLKQFYDAAPQSDIIIPVFFPLIIHALYCKKKRKTKNVISLFQDFKEMYWFGRYICFLLGLKGITKNTDKFIAVSRSAADEIKKYSGIDAAVIPNGIEHEYFYPRTSAKENYILFIGSSSKMKGLEYFLKAFDLIEKEFPNIKAKIVIPSNITIKNHNIEIIDAVKDRNKLGVLYSKALIFISQSLGDSFGMPPLEAMASGTAVVMTDTAGSREYAADNENCLIVPVKSPEKTAQAVIKLLKNETLRCRLEQQGIKTAQKFKWDDAFEKFNKEVLLLNGNKN